MIKIASDKLSAEWMKLIEENSIPDRVDGELTLNEFCELSNIGKSTGERLLNREMKAGRIIRHQARVENRCQYVYTIIKK